MRVTAILTAAERKRQDRSVHRAEERRRRAKMMRVCGPTCPHSSVWTHASAVQAPKRLINKRKLAILTSNGMPLGECRFGFETTHHSLTSYVGRRTFAGRSAAQVLRLTSPVNCIRKA